MLARYNMHRNTLTIHHKKTPKTRDCQKNHQLISFWQMQVIWFGGFLTVWILDHYSGEGVYNHIWHLFPRQTDKNQPQSILAYHKRPSSSRILFSDVVKKITTIEKIRDNGQMFSNIKEKKTLVNVLLIIPSLPKKAKIQKS